MKDKGLAWDMRKLNIRSFSAAFCIKKKEERTKFKKELEKELQQLENSLDKNNSIEELNQDNSNKNELEKMEQAEINGPMFRSKVKWCEDGEKNSMYFLSLEKRNYVNKLIKQLQINYKIIKEPLEISDALRSFYKNLYSQKLNENDDSYQTSLNLFLQNENSKMLTQEDEELCECELSKSKF